MKNRFGWIAALACAAMVPVTGAADEGKTRYLQRWFYASHNLLVKKDAAELVSLIERGGSSGYNGVVLADYKLNKLAQMPPDYFKNVALVKEAAARTKIEIIPCVFPIGYSAGLLAHDPNLAEGLPVKEAPFVVKGTEAVLTPDPGVRLVNGDLEEARGNRFAGFSFQDDPGKKTFADRDVAHHGKTSCRMEGGTGNCRLFQQVKVRPWACYRLSCWIKTRDYQPRGEFKLQALAAGKDKPPLTFFDGHLGANQDWTRHDVTFNSLDQNEVQIMVGQWTGMAGTLWLDELALEELALVNVLRRDGCPLVVASADGKVAYEEGKDFGAVRDPWLGRKPSVGDYEYQHAGPSLRLTDGSRIKDGDRLRVSWYHPILTHSYQVMCCMGEPKVYELLRDQARRVNELYQPRTFMMGHDEIRVAGWCRTCQGRPPGDLLADNVRRCVAILKETNPKARVMVWNDMFDPNHNARDRYYLVNGSLAGSWKGLPADAIIANWNAGKAEASLKFFAERGHSQIVAGYYDGGLDNFKKWDAAVRGVPRVEGFLYTTWKHRYGDLETYGKAMQGKP